MGQQKLLEPRPARARGEAMPPRPSPVAPGEAGRVSATFVLSLLATAVSLLAIVLTIFPRGELPRSKTAPLTYRVFCRAGRVEISTRSLEELPVRGGQSVCQYKGETDTLATADATARSHGGVGAACRDCDQGREKRVYCVAGKIRVEEKTLEEMGLAAGDVHCELPPDQVPKDIDKDADRNIDKNIDEKIYGSCVCPMSSGR